jgi:hypothetical protein
VGFAVAYSEIFCRWLPDASLAPTRAIYFLCSFSLSRGLLRHNELNALSSTKNYSVFVKATAIPTSRAKKKMKNQKKTLMKAQGSNPNQVSGQKDFGICGE